MVSRQLRSRDLQDERVLDAMATVPRHLFVPRAWQRQAYDDTPLPLGCEQTISQPYIVAFLCEQARLAHADRVLEIGSGSGNQAAVQAEMGMEVYSIEIDPALSDRARENLARAGYPAVRLRAGAGYRGWPAAAPFPGCPFRAALSRAALLGGGMARPRAARAALIQASVAQRSPPCRSGRWKSVARAWEWEPSSYQSSR